MEIVLAGAKTEPQTFFREIVRDSQHYLIQVTTLPPNLNRQYDFFLRKFISLTDEQREMVEAQTSVPLEVKGALLKAEFNPKRTALFLDYILCPARQHQLLWGAVAGRVLEQKKAAQIASDGVLLPLKPGVVAKMCFTSNHSGEFGDVFLGEIIRRPNNPYVFSKLKERGQEIAQALHTVLREPLQELTGNPSMSNKFTHSSYILIR